MLGNWLDQTMSSRPIRKAMDAGFRWYARHRREEIDRQSIAETQQETLLRLVRQARHTRFGREHDFAGIRTIEDYQERVPLRDYEAIWQEYWQPEFPSLNNVTWPGSYPYFALSSGTTTGGTKYIPVTRAMLRSNERAALTALAWFQGVCPQATLFSGRMFFLGGSTDLQPAGTTARRSASLQGDLSGIVAKEAPALARSFTFPPVEVSLLGDWERKLDLLARQSIELPITAITGVPSWLLALFDRVRRISGRDRLSEIWPTLQLIVHGGTKFDPYRNLFRELLGSEKVRCLETYPASEGFVAAEDPRYGMLRLIPDHGVFYEFVPVNELSASDPIRHTAAEVVPGVQYAVVLTTCAGLWSYVLGDTVCFESRDPPLLRFTGRTRQFLSAFGEHLIGEEVERAVTDAATQTGAAVVDFHVGPVFPESPGAPGRHRYLVEFATLPANASDFGWAVDASLCEQNEDYRAHRQGDLTLAEPEVMLVPRGGFARWMQAQGKLGGQHKVPRMDNSGQLTRSLEAWLEAWLGERVRA
jgi:GH3 auxin-responsive promoter